MPRCSNDAGVDNLTAFCGDQGMVNDYDGEDRQLRQAVGSRVERATRATLDKKNARKNIRNDKKRERQVKWQLQKEEWKEEKREKSKNERIKGWNAQYIGSHLTRRKDFDVVDKEHAGAKTHVKFCSNDTKKSRFCIVSLLGMKNGYILRIPSVKNHG
ncbi:hypothetical protein ALC57_16599 [Trachymyrmex cornetzi]|uniref:Uncharacterized protein n=1 Tax=Trachymyrmex cornetzi TaxID=471704 RepID=A0A151IUV6_9HYME|nr:hypothetical protein ALC57_16599 [Trachymyrmex cornetzi]